MEDRVRQRLLDLLGLENAAVSGVEKPTGTRVGGYIKAGPHTFAVETKRAGTLAAIRSAIDQVKEHVDGGVDAIPLVVVPFMGQAGRERCEEAKVSWLDLSGNARIVAPGLRIIIDGRPNLFKQRGRPSTAFAPKSSRVARWLLMHSDKFMIQRQIAQATNMDEGFTSRIISRLREQNLVVRDDKGAVGVSDPRLLLEAWREIHDFSKSEIVRGHVAARSSEALLGELAGSLEDNGIQHAATGLGAAWLLTRFAGFRTVTFYVRPWPSNELLDKIGFREEDRGANVWLVVPKDEGVFHGQRHVEGIECVHPVQVYLDLKGHPERAAEAADELLARELTWSSHA